MSSGERSQQFVEKILGSLLKGETLKGLKKLGVGDVQVITRRDFEKALKTFAESNPTEAAKGIDKSARRVELLLIEIERLRKEKSDLEHQKGLAESERAALRGRLDEIVNAGSKAFGEKVSIEGIQELIRERDGLRVEVEALREQGEEARSSYEETITSLRVAKTGVEAEREALNAELRQARLDIDRLRADLEASRNLAANHKRRVNEIELQLEDAELRVTERAAEISAMRDDFEAERDGFKKAVAAKDAEIELLKNPPEPEQEVELEAEAEAQPARDRSLTALRPQTRKMTTRTKPVTTRRGRETASYDYGAPTPPPSPSRPTRSPASPNRSTRSWRNGVGQER